MDAGNRLGVFASVKNAGTFLALNFDPLQRYAVAILGF
jgi:hypothetical protein